MGEIVANRGSVVWGFNAFRRDALVNLLNDLLERKENGLNKTECDLVAKAIGKIVHIATAIPDGSWVRGAIWKELQNFEKIYERWNSHEGNDPEIVKNRIKELKNLRKSRHNIARKVRKNGHIIDKELDLTLVEDMYAAFGGLVKALPDIFTNLSRAINHFNKRKKPK